MKKTLTLTTLATVALSLGLSGINAHADDTGAKEASTNATLNVEGGNLAITKGADLDFGTLTLSGSDQSSTANSSIKVTDYRGSYEGWSVKVSKASTDTWDDAMTIDLGQGSLNEDGLNFKEQAATDGYSLDQDLAFTATLNVPKAVKAATYSTTLVWDLSNTPEEAL